MLYRPRRANIMKIFKLNGVFSGVFIIIDPGIVIDDKGNSGGCSLVYFIGKLLSY